MSDEIIKATIKRINGPYNNNWCIVMTNQGTIKGTMPAAIKIGDLLEVKGFWADDPKWGPQFTSKEAKIVAPQTERGMVRYLMRRMPGVGDVIANAMVKYFGPDKILDVIKNDPESLTNVKGISHEKAENISVTYNGVVADTEADLFFATHGITDKLKERLEATYGDLASAFAAVRENPYQLIDDVHGVGFKKADAIAMSAGIPKDSPFRIDAALADVLRQAANNGHCYMSLNDHVRQTVERLSLSHALVYPRQAACRETVIEDGRVYYQLIWEHEVMASDYVKRLAPDFIVSKGETNWLKDQVEELTEQMGMPLDPDQKQAVVNTFRRGISVITGGPGVGKTYTITTIIEALTKIGKIPEDRILLAAPTGKAAKRMAEQTKRNASTIHRLLEYHPIFGWRVNKDNPITGCFLIIDEASMMDISMFYHLMDAVGKGTRVLLVGDVDQLPSVGPGRVLSDLITSEPVHVTRLTTLHRQAALSMINQNAQLMNAGAPIIVDNEIDSDFRVIFQDDKDAIAGDIVDILGKIDHRPYTFRWDEEKKPHSFTAEDVQILAPQKKGPVGVEPLNKLVRDVIYNPKGLELGNTGLRVGDRVIQTKNDYDLGVFNGEIGVILEGTKTGGECYVNFNDDREPVKYNRLDMNNLLLAYALTIHKSQGSEFPVVIIPVHQTNTFMLKRNLLYTGATRARKLTILVGTEKAIAKAIRTPDTTKRNTTLQARLDDPRIIGVEQTLDEILDENREQATAPRPAKTTVPIGGDDDDDLTSYRDLAEMPLDDDELETWFD